MYLVYIMEVNYQNNYSASEIIHGLFGTSVEAPPLSWIDGLSLLEGMMKLLNESNAHKHTSVLYIISKMRADLAFYDLLSLIKMFKDLWDQQTTFQALIALQNMLGQTLYSPLDPEMLQYLETKQSDDEDRISEAATIVIEMHQQKKLQPAQLLLKSHQVAVKIMLKFSQRLFSLKS